VGRAHGLPYPEPLRALGFSGVKSAIDRHRRIGENSIVVAAHLVAHPCCPQQGPSFPCSMNV
jgi:hypothetical protein